MQRRDRILPREDEEIARELEDHLRAEGIDIWTRAVPTRVEPGPVGRAVVIATVAGVEERVEADRILVATGRRPHHLGLLGLETAGTDGDAERGIVMDPTPYPRAEGKPRGRRSGARYVLVILTSPHRGR